jgi:flagella basal body P-ring formation protein FlgA
MLLLRVLLLASLLGPVLVCRAAGLLEIELRPDAQVSGQRYAMGALALIRGGDEEERARVGAMQIGATPRMGYTESVTQEALAHLMARRDPALAARIRWTGAATVAVRGREQKLAGKELDDTAARALTACLAGHYDTLEMAPIAATADLSRPQGTLTLATEACPTANASRRMRMMVEVQVDGQIYTRVAVWFSVHAFAPALLAVRPLAAGRPLQADAFEVKSLDVTTLAAPPLDPLRPLAGLRLRFPLQAQDALLATAVESRPAVLRDHTVQVRVTSGAIQLETVGIALADGRLGEAVRVRNGSTQEAFLARVVDNDIVTLSGE